MAILYDDYKKKYGENIKEYQKQYNVLKKEQNKITNTTKKKNDVTSSANNKINTNNKLTSSILKKRQEQVLETVKNKQKTTPTDASRNFTLPTVKNNPLQQMNDAIEATKRSPLNDELKKVVSQNTEDTKWNKLPIIAGKTIGTGSALLTRGGLGALEKFHEFSLNASSNINSFLGEKLGIYTKEEAEKERKSAQELIKRSLKNEVMEKIGWNEDLWQEMEKGSLVKRDNIGGKVIEGIGEMLPTLAVGSSVGATGNLTKVQRLITSIPTSLTMGVGAYGGSLEQAYNEGATTSQANKYALGSALVETATEWLTGGVPGVNDAGILDSLEDKTLSKVSNSLAKFLIKNSYNVIGEGTEEALSEIINPILKNATYSQGEKVDWNAVIESAIVGGITGGILDIPGNISSYNTDVNTAKLKQQQISNQATRNFIEQNNLKPTQINTNEISLPKIDTNQEVNVQQNLEKLSTKNNINLPKPTNVDSNIFSRQVDEVVNGTFPQKNMLTVSENTPQILQDIGLDNLPITMTQRHLKTIMNSEGEYKGANYHDLGIDVVKQLPQAISNPLNILKSDTNSDSIVIITELADKLDRPIIASIKIDGTGTINDIEIDSNVLTSAYGRNNYDAFMQRNIAKGNLLYDIDEGIIKRSDGKLQLRPTTSSKTDIQGLQLSNNISSSIDNNTTNSTQSQIAPLPSQYNMQQNVENDTKIPTYKDFAKEKVDNKVAKQSLEAIKKATNVGKSYLQLKYSEAKTLRNDLKEYLGLSKEQLINSKTYNGIKNKVEQFINRQVEYLNEDMKQIKKEIRNTKIKIDDNLKEQITDYNYFRKQNFGRLKLSNTGQGIDSVYQELSSAYPYYFDSNITTEADMLYELSNFMDKPDTILEEYKLSDNDIKKATDKIFNSLINNSLSNEDIETMQNEILKKYSKRTRKVIQEKLLHDMGITVGDIQVGKDINSIDFQRTDPIRVNEKVFGYEVGKKINDATIYKTKHNEAERTRFLNKERNEIKELGIKPRSKESAAVQKYGEKQYVNEHDELVKYGDKELTQEFSDIETQNKIKNAAKVIRDKYDTYIDEINSVITELGYNPIPKRPDYMRHFQELDDKLSKWGIPLNPTDLNKENIPTDINGLTDQFKPGKNWFASAMTRKGLKTTYDAITGIDGYLEGASNLMYHTEDIQRYRTLSKFIRETYGQTHGLDDVANMTEEQAQQRIDDVYNNKLSKYVAWLDEQANALAGKKGGIDRAAERILGRKIYTVLDTAKKQVGSNMTGFNVRSALTNFASSVQGASKTNKIAFIKGTVSTVKNIIHNDGLIDKSDFLTSRFGSDQLSKKLWQKASNAGQILMTGSDYFTANQIWRSKYFENLQKGMNETEAIKNADDFSSRVMGDRSKGSTAEIFNSKTLGLLTQFQLEVNNQWSSIIHDNKMDIKSGNKSGATVLFQLGQLAAMSYFFNNFMKSLTGTDVMIDPIDMLMKIIGSDDDEEKTLEKRAQEVLGDLVNDLPFASTLTGGRIPISEAFTGANTLFKKATGQTDSYGNEIKWEDVKDDIITSAFYWLLPTGYGQLKKTTKGVSMYNEDNPIPGSYTASGNLRFNADTSTGGKIKAALFGEYSSGEAQKYIDSGFKAISKSRLQEMEKLGMSASEYREYRSGLNAAGTTNAKKIDYIVNSNYSNKQKNIMAKDLLDRDFNIKEYEKYESYEEYDYAYKYPEKYAVISKITSFDKYNSYKEKLDDIRTNTTNDKTETIKYINSLNLSIPQKAMFIKMYYPSFDNYNKQIINYVNSQSMTVEEKTKILEYLGFTVRNGRVY